MSRFEIPAAGAAILTMALGLSAFTATAQTVAMSGQYHQSSGRTVNLPINPLTPCDPSQSARCHGAGVNGGTPAYVEPSSGVPVAGGHRIIPGGLGVGDAFTVPTDAFTQPGVRSSTPILNNVAILQLDTTFSYAGPASGRARTPAPLTRVMSAMNWTKPGAGQAGRLAANTTPLDPATQTEFFVGLSFDAGPNEFGGTMAMLLAGSGRVYLNGVILGSAAGATSTRPWVGTNPVGGSPTFRTRDGAGWGYTTMGGQPPGVIINNAGFAAPCTQEFPPGPAGCGLVTDFTGTTIGTIPAATSTRWLYPWTTGTVEVVRTGTVGGNPFNQTLTGMGYDTTSMTTGGGTVRNIGLVTGGYYRRTSASGVDNLFTVTGMDLQFVPEPGALASLVFGVGCLGALTHRRRNG
ncbi:MAG: PEP-CTERM sorting domain-containing protein [bacterium]|nr:PEP-CTERM sorting domain-containing protein [bacterium]